MAERDADATACARTSESISRYRLAEPMGVMRLRRRGRWDAPWHVSVLRP